jgi:hypothetical protein
MNEVIDGRIRVEFLTDVPYTTFTYRVSQRGGSTIYANTTFTLYAVKHTSFPPPSINTSSTGLDLVITSFGYDSYTTNLDERLTEWFTSWISNNSPISSNEIKIICEGAPKKGILVTKSNPKFVATQFSVADIIENNLRYISFDPNTIEDETLKVRFAYQDEWSPIYDLSLKHYYSHFYPYACNISLVSESSRSVRYPTLTSSMIDAGLSWTTETTVLPMFDSEAPLSSNEVLWEIPSVTSNIWEVATFGAGPIYETILNVDLDCDVDQADCVSQ